MLELHSQLTHPSTCMSSGALRRVVVRGLSRGYEGHRGASWTARCGVHLSEARKDEAQNMTYSRTLFAEELHARAGWIGMRVPAELRERDGRPGLVHLDRAVGSSGLADGAEPHTRFLCHSSLPSMANSSIRRHDSAHLALLAHPPRRRRARTRPPWRRSRTRSMPCLMAQTTSRSSSSRPRRPWYAPHS